MRDTMTEEMMGAVRTVINFARMDEKYARLANSKSRNAYFEEKLAEIAADWNVDKTALRKTLIGHLTNDGAISAQEWAEAHAQPPGVR